MPTNKEIQLDKIRWDIERERALEVARQLAEELRKDIGDMTDTELLDWANEI